MNNGRSKKGYSVEIGQLERDELLRIASDGKEVADDEKLGKQRRSRVFIEMRFVYVDAMTAAE